MNRKLSKFKNFINEAASEPSKPKTKPGTKPSKPSREPIKEPKTPLKPSAKKKEDKKDKKMENLTLKFDQFINESGPATAPSKPRLSAPCPIHWP